MWAAAALFEEKALLEGRVQTAGGDEEQIRGEGAEGSEGELNYMERIG